MEKDVFFLFASLIGAAFSGLFKDCLLIITHIAYIGVKSSDFEGSQSTLDNCRDLKCEYLNAHIAIFWVGCLKQPAISDIVYNDFVLFGMSWLVYI